MPRAPSAYVAVALLLRSEEAGTIKLVSPERDISRSVPRVVGMASTITRKTIHENGIRVLKFAESRCCLRSRLRSVDSKHRAAPARHRHARMWMLLLCYAWQWKNNRRPVQPQHAVSVQLRERRGNDLQRLRSYNRRRAPGPNGSLQQRSLHFTVTHPPLKPPVTNPGGGLLQAVPSR